jgi:hypothetical protein
MGDRSISEGDVSCTEGELSMTGGELSMRDGDVSCTDGELSIMLGELSVTACGLWLLLLLWLFAEELEREVLRYDGPRMRRRPCVCVGI